MKIRKIKATQFRLEVEKERKMMPEPAFLLERAKRFPEAPTHLAASDYGETIHAMREKGYTWKECGQWVRAHGADFSDQALIGGYQTWCKNSPAQEKRRQEWLSNIQTKADDERKRADVINILWAAGRKVASIEELDTAIARAEAARQQAGK